MKRLDPQPLDSFEWSAWQNLVDGAPSAPRLPGLYQARIGHDGPVRYVGKAGSRKGQGLRGRLLGYTSGRSVASGLGFHATSRALQDPGFVEQVLRLARSGEAPAVHRLCTMALEHFDIYVAWATADSEMAAHFREGELQRLVGRAQLWNTR